MDTRKPTRPLDPLSQSPGDEPIEPFDRTERDDVPEPSERAQERDRARDTRSRRDPLNLDDLFDL
jgi:hypothetical protein